MSQALPPEDGAWTIEQLLAAEASGERLKFLLFWGHTAPHDGSIGPHVLSQWWPHSFAVDNTIYASAEHFMMAEKARLFSDDENRAAIIAAKSPGEAKALGRRVRRFEQEAWESERFEIVKRGSVAKFGSDNQLRDYLLATGTRVLVEASPRDRIWGIGMGRNNPDAEQPSRWRGRNLLGFALMAARADLRRVSAR